MPQVLEQLQLSIGSLGQNWCAEGFHDLLDGDALVGELVSCRAAELRDDRSAYGRPEENGSRGI